MKIAEEILRRNMARKKKVTFSEEAEHLGLDQESGEWPTSEEDAEEEKSSGSPMNGKKTQRGAAMTKIVYAWYWQKRK